MSDQSDRILVSLPRYDAEQLLTYAPITLEGDGLESLSASLAAPDGIPTAMINAAYFGAESDEAQNPTEVLIAALSGARDFVPNHQPTP